VIILEEELLYELVVLRITVALLYEQVILGEW
jgi:hypothetical protein